MQKAFISACHGVIECWSRRWDRLLYYASGMYLILMASKTKTLSDSSDIVKFRSDESKPIRSWEESSDEKINQRHLPLTFEKR